MKLLEFVQIALPLLKNLDFLSKLVDRPHCPTIDNEKKKKERRKKIKVNFDGPSRSEGCVER